MRGLKVLMSKIKVHILEKLSQIFIKVSFKTAILTSCIILGLLSLISLMYRGYFHMFAWEEMSFYNNNWKFYSLLFIFSLTMLFVAKIIGRFSSFRLFLFFTSIYLIIGTYLSINADLLLRADPHYLFLAAIEMNNGDFSSFDKITSANYMSTFPNQMGLLTLFRMYAYFTTNTHWLFFLQTLMVSGINYLLWQITNLIFDNKVINNLVILLSHLFLPSIFLTLWVYGDIPGLLCSLITIYFFLKFEKSQSIFSGLVLVFFLTLACILRSNYLILAITLVISLLISWIRNPKFVKLIVIACIPFSFIVINKLIESYYESKIHAEITYPPQQAWIVMGLNDKINNPGYWDQYTTEIRVWNNYNDNKVEKVVTNDLKERIRVLTSDKDYAKNFFFKKLMVTWNDPTFQSIFAGPLAARGQNIKTDFLKNLYGEGNIYHFYNKYMSILVTYIYLSSFILVVYLLFKKINDADFNLLIFLIYLIGGFIFHLFWETKARYVYPYVYLLLPIVAFNISWFSNKLFSKRSKI